MPPFRTVLLHLAFALLCLTMHSCGFGTVGVIGASSGSSGTANAPSTPAGLLVLDAQVSPARILIVLTDAESDTASVEFFYASPADGVERRLTGLAANPVALPANSDGVRHELEWRFADEEGLGTQYQPDVQLIARIRGGVSQSVAVGLGNDAPAVEIVAPDSEAVGVVPIRIRISDSSDDPVDVRVEWSLAATPDTRAIARSAGLDASSPTPELAFRGTVAPSSTDEVVFFWDTASPLGDLIDLERQVILRVTLIDSAGAESFDQTAAFTIDNNDAPTMQIGEGLVLNPDLRRGIPIPFTAFDPEGDAVRMLFQWRRLEEPTFPSLGSDDPAVLAALMRDPDFVREKHICAPFRAFTGGLAQPVSAATVRLPELRSSASSILTVGGMEFGNLDLLRDQTIRSLKSTWSQNELSQPTAALPIGDGITALVLGGQAATSSLHEIDLATGAVTAIATGLAGVPTALALGANEERALVATDFGGSWQLYAVELRDGLTSTLMNATGTGPIGSVRGILPASETTALVTVGDSVWRLDWSGSGSMVKLRGSLNAPWGLLADPLRPQRVLIAERDANRIVSFDLNTGALEPIPVNMGVTMTAPTAITSFDRGAGPQLLALCDGTVPGQKQVLARNLGSQNAPAVSLAVFSQEAASVAAGPDGLVMVALPTSNDLAVGGGIEQRRVIADVDLPSATVTVTAPFAPAIRPTQRWRVGIGQALFVPIRSTAAGAQNVFVWDCRQAGLRCGVLVRGTAFDTEIGGQSQSTIAMQISNSDTLTLPTGVSPLSILAADVDGDGDLDLVGTNASNNNVVVYRQDAPRVFTPQPPLAAGTGPRSIAAGDLDGDGDLDLVSANLSGNSLTVFFQDSPATFTAQPPLATGDGPISLAIADLDGDLDLDIVCSNQNDSTLTVFLQTSPRVFVAQPTLATGARPWWVTSADLDADGDMDLVSANFDGDSLTLFLQGPLGTFQPQPELPAGDGPQAVTAGDVDGDGHMDLACANSFDGTVTIYFQDALGAFTPTVTLVGQFPKMIALADLDNDNDLDVACANGFGDSVAVFYQEAPRSFSAQQRLVAGSFASTIAAADLDGDGSIDLACTSNDNTLQVFFQDGSRQISPQPPLPSADFLEGIATGDLDGDGDLDVVAANPSTDQVTVYFQDAPRAFSPQAPLAAGDEPNTVAIADLDSDGDLDFVSANTNSNDLTIFYQVAPRMFAAQPPLPVDDRPFSVIAADLDGDGDIDIACASSQNSTVTVLFQDAPGTFTALPVISSVPAFSLRAEDIDADGDMDLVAAAANSLTVLFQDAPRAFTAQTVIGGGGYDVAVADLDGNGLPDLLTANLVGNNVQIFYQNSARVFTASTPLPAGQQTNSVAAGDLDGDGDLDIVCSNNSSNELITYFQDSPGTFTQQPFFSTGSGPRRVNLVDMDRDGDLDVVYVLATSGQLLVLFGRR